MTSRVRDTIHRTRVTKQAVDALLPGELQPS